MTTIKTKTNFLKFNWKIISILSFSVFLLIIYFMKTFFIAIVDGRSMEPTIHHKDILIINTCAYDNSLPKYKDIINIEAHDFCDNYMVKRIIGLPGDIIEINYNNLYINGNLIDEYYINEPMDKKSYYLKIEIPEDSYFVMGDNRNISFDSRSYGFITSSQIHGKVLFKISCEDYSIVNLLYN